VAAVELLALMSTSRTWDTASIPDLTGRTVVVTGANSGLGLEATRAFARKGATVVMACRDESRGDAAARDVRRTVRDADTEVRELDLASLDSIAAFAESFTSDYEELHMLCNNAGVMAVPRRETADGFESQFGINHLGHFALTGHLLPVLRETEGQTRVVTHSSEAHRRGRIDFDDLQGEREYSAWGAYGQSKLANLLFAYELDRRVPAAWNLASVACHPGWAATNLQRRGPEARDSRIGGLAARAANVVFAQSASEGALPLCYAASAEGIRGGEYVGPGGFMNMRGQPVVQRSSDRSYDRDAADQLWQVSEELTGVEFGLDDDNDN
jgi:NAD(P)-dependent dehydrogenase (short-subunit alcohol dehydrogenase family)